MNGFFQLPDGTRGFVDGVKPDHECNSEGSILILVSGERVADTADNRKKHRDDIQGGSVVCSICGQAAIDRALWDYWE